jgi:hypothetical protein
VKKRPRQFTLAEIAVICCAVWVVSLTVAATIVEMSFR